MLPPSVTEKRSRCVLDYARIVLDMLMMARGFAQELLKMEAQKVVAFLSFDFFIVPPLYTFVIST